MTTFDYDLNRKQEVVAQCYRQGDEHAEDYPVTTTKEDSKI